jgi:hypothetical protein
MAEVTLLCSCVIGLSEIVENVIMLMNFKLNDGKCYLGICIYLCMYFFFHTLGQLRAR